MFDYFWVAKFKGHIVFSGSGICMCSTSSNGGLNDVTMVWNPLTKDQLLDYAFDICFLIGCSPGVIYIVVLILL